MTKEEEEDRLRGGRESKAGNNRGKKGREMVLAHTHTENMDSSVNPPEQ